MKLKKSYSQLDRRRGAVAVEAAFAIPVIIILTLGTLDICDGIYLKKKAEIAAYEGVRVAVGVDGSDESVRDAVANHLTSRNVQFENIFNVVTITRDPTQRGEPDVLDQLDPVTVRVEIDLQSNGRLPISPFRHIQGPQMTAEVTMLFEGGDSLKEEEERGGVQ